MVDEQSLAHLRLMSDVRDRMVFQLEKNDSAHAVRAATQAYLPHTLALLSATQQDMKIGECDRG